MSVTRPPSAGGWARGPFASGSADVDLAGAIPKDESLPALDPTIFAVSVALAAPSGAAGAPKRLTGRPAFALAIP